MQAKRGRPRKNPAPATIPIVQGTSPAPLPAKIDDSQKTANLNVTYTYLRLDKMLSVAEELKHAGHPIASEAMFYAVWVYAKEIYDRCSPKLEPAK